MTKKITSLKDVEVKLLKQSKKTAKLSWICPHCKNLLETVTMRNYNISMKLLKQDIVQVVCHLAENYILDHSREPEIYHRYLDRRIIDLTCSYCKTENSEWIIESISKEELQQYPKGRYLCHTCKEKVENNE